MQLIWLLIVTLVCSLGEKLVAAHQVTTTYMYYSDETDVDIAEELVLYQTDLSTMTQLSIEFGIDSVTSASFDTGAAATVIATDEVEEETDDKVQLQDEDDDEDDTYQRTGQSQTKVRQSGNISLTHSWTHDLKTTTSLSGSSKSDYKSWTVGQSFTWGINSKTTVAVGGYYTSNDNDPELATTNVYWLPPEGEDLDSTRMAALISVEQILSPTQKLKLLAEYFNSQGYQSTGYQRLPITNSDLTHEVLEVLPDSRRGAALTAVYSKWFDPGIALHLRGRYYKDTYSVSALSIDVSTPFYLKEDWVVTPRYRYYDQKKARFWLEESEDIPSGYFTNHYALGDIKAHQVGLGVARNFDINLYGRPYFGSVQLNYDYYTAESGFYYNAVSLGATVNF